MIQSIIVPNIRHKVLFVMNHFDFLSLNFDGNNYLNVLTKNINMK